MNILQFIGFTLNLMKYKVFTFMANFFFFNNFFWFLDLESFQMTILMVIRIDLACTVFPDLV